MVELYVKLIEMGKKTIDSIPDPELRRLVAERLGITEEISS